MEKIRQVPRDAAQQQGFNNYDLCVLNKKNQVKMYTMPHKRSKSLKNQDTQTLPYFQ